MRISFQKLRAHSNFSYNLFLQLAEEYGVKFMETSAKTGYNVENVSNL